MSQVLFPDSRLRTIITPHDAQNMGVAGFWVPIFCPSCGISGGSVPQENMHFAFWMCNDCFAKHGETTLFMTTPDAVFWEEVKQAQLAKYRRFLTPEEVADKLTDPESLESRLARDRKLLTPHAGD